MGIMVRVPVSVLIMAAAPGDSGASRGVQTAPYSKERSSAQPCLDASYQTSELVDRTQEFNMQMDLAFRKQCE